MAYDILPGMSITPTCIGGSCLPTASMVTIVANATMIALLIVAGYRYVAKLRTQA